MTHRDVDLDNVLRTGGVEDSRDGFPTLFAAIDRQHEDRTAVLELLLDAGADVGQRGINDYTALHHAACRDDPEAVNLLLRRGADPSARTRIDDYATPLEEAEKHGHWRGADAIAMSGFEDTDIVAEGE